MSIPYARLISAHFTASAADGSIDGPELARAIALAKEAGAAPGAREALAEGVRAHRGKMDPSIAATADHYLAHGTSLSFVDPFARDDLRAALVGRESGGITAAELKSAHTRVGETYGADHARGALPGALFGRTEHLTPEAALELQKTAGSMDGHVARYQKLVEQHHPGAALVDADFDGKPSRFDRLQTMVDGEVRSVEIGQAMADDLTVRGAIVSAAYDMAQARHGFVSENYPASFSERFFQRSDKPDTFELKPGVSASEAIQDMFANPKDYNFECATAMVVTYYKAMHDMLGPEAFDRVASDLKIGPWQMEGDLRSNLRFEGNADTPAQPGMREAMRAGDYGYIKSWDATPDAIAAGARGENVIALPDGKLYGHPFGVATAEKIIDNLDLGRHEGSTRSAGFTHVRRQLDAEILRARTRP